MLSHTHTHTHTHTYTHTHTHTHTLPHAQVKSMSSESSAMVDKRIMSKLLVTYFERNCAHDVLALMARMLQMHEEDVNKVKT